MNISGHRNSIVSQGFDLISGKRNQSEKRIFIFGRHIHTHTYIQKTTNSDSATKRDRKPLWTSLFSAPDVSGIHCIYGMLIIIHLFIAPFGPFSPILPAIFLRLVIATIILPISIQACSSVRIPYFSRLFSLFYLCSIIFIASKWASVCLMCSYGMLSHFHRFLDRFRCFGGSIRFMSCIRFVAFLCSVGFEHWFLFCRVGLISLFFILCMDSCWFFGYIRVGGKRRAAAASQADKLFIQAISFIRRPEIAKYIAHAYNNNYYYIHETRVLRVYAKK